MLNQAPEPVNNLSEMTYADLINSSSVPPVLVLGNKDHEILRFDPNGDIFVKGKLTTNDMEVVNGFRELLQLNYLIN